MSHSELKALTGLTGRRGTMARQDDFVIRKTAAVIEQALHAIDCYPPIRLIEHGSAIRIGSASDNLTVRYNDHLWKVHEHTPYMDCTHTYATMADCARDIALCDESSLQFERVDLLEQQINNAIRQALHN
jgi:hypothetical protein